MKESLELSQQQRLQQRLHPEQMLYGRLLEMSTPEIEDEVRRVVDENPALIERTPDAQDGADTFAESAEQLQRADYANDDEVPFARSDWRPYNAATDFDMPAAAPGETLSEALKGQLTDFNLGTEDRAIAEYIIDNLDDNGYLTRSPSAMADDLTAATGSEFSAGRFRDMLQVVRRLEPAGVGAVDLRDCMSLQLARMKDSPALGLAREIVAHHFDAFSKRHSDRLRSALGCSEQQLSEAVELLRALDPKPGGHADNSTDSRTRYIVPDFTVDIDNDGRATIGLTGRLPELEIEESFVPGENAGTASRRDRETYAFVRARHDEAQSFIKMLNARGRTLMAVMKAIVARQKDFFTSADKSSIRPMILRDIAADTGYDLSVISRATAGKYVATPSGVYPVKLFFNERPIDETDASSHELAEKIKTIIETEDKEHPLSDEAIRSELASQGYEIARRTVAKYREKSGIPVARLRKKF